MLDLSSLADPELMVRVAGGDELALGAIYDRHGAVIYGTVLRFLQDSHATEEIVQDTFLAAWRRSDSFAPEAGSLIGWLLRIARNRAIDRLRTVARRPTLVDFSTIREDSVGRDHDGPYPLLRTRHARTQEPEAVVYRRWAGSVVRSALAAIPDLERRALELAYDEGLSQSEIAVRLGWPLGTVKSRTRRALAAMRTVLEGVPDLVDGVSHQGAVPVSSESGRIGASGRARGAR